MISRRRAMGLIAALPALAPALAHAQDETPELVADRIFGAWLSDHEAPGGMLGVVRNGQLQIAKGYGVRSLENPFQPDPDTLYCIASVTKAITAFAVLLLCDDGRLALDQPAARWLSDLPAQWSDITIRQFLCHVSGIPRDGAIRRADWQGSMAAAARLSIRQPGERTRYNNFNYVVAGRLIETASGLPYADFVRDRIFVPLGMSRSHIGETYDYNRAVGYRLAHGGLVEPPLWAEAGPQYDAAGRGFSSLNDLLAFLAAIREGRLLSAQGLAEMTRPYGPAQRGTCGWFAKVAGGVPFTEKLGRLSGYSIDVEFNARGDAIVMIWNLQVPQDRSNRPRAALRQALLGIGSGEPDSPYPSVRDEHEG
jgi:CubicO group peptidase (beta-lactamase class C family)